LYIVLFIQFHAMRSYLPIFTLILIFAGACIHWSCESNSSSPSETSKIDKASQKNTSIADIEREIRRHIAEVTEEDGYFTLDTDTQNLQLQLVRVHTEYLSVLDTNEFFACVDLATTSGDVYDVDFFLRGTSDNMSVTQTDLHKLNGKPFYSWKQKEDGRWTQVPTAGASSELLGVIEGEDHFQFTYTVVLPEWDGKASMWLPLASSDSFQTIDLQSIKGPKLNWEQRRDSAWNNKYMYASFDDQYVGDTIRIEYEVLRREKSAYPAKEDILAPYLGATPFLPIGGRFESLARKITDSRSAQTPLSQARALYDYISDSPVMRKKELMELLMLNMPAMRCLAIAQSSIPCLSHLHVLWEYPPVLPWGQPYLPSAMREEWMDITVGPNFTRTVSGGRWTLAKQINIQP